MIVLGVNAYHGDASAALLVDGEIVAAVEEERFTRVKHDTSFPHHAIRFCLDTANIGIGEPIPEILEYALPKVHRFLTAEGIRDEVVFRALLPAVHRAGTHTLAPPTARTGELSTTAADKSMRYRMASGNSFQPSLARRSPNSSVESSLRYRSKSTGFEHQGHLSGHL